jgi:ankyrin repeat protein
VEERFELEYTPLHIAAKCARLLLEAGANPNQGDVDCCTPMVRVASMAMLELLMEHGADPNIPDQCGHKPSYWATNAELKNRLLAMENMGRRNSRG